MSSNNKKSRQGLCHTLRYALALNGDFYENARNTQRNQRLALSIVILAAISHAIGSGIILLINRATVFVLLTGLLIDAIAIVAGYYFWTFTIFKIGQWLKPIDPTYGDLLIPIGFAYAPQILNFLTLIPLLGRPIELILALWSLLAVIVAVRQGLDITTRRATFICLVGWPLIQIAIGFVQVLEQQLVRWTS
ncbi:MULTISPECIES: Yip1 family protein [Nostoc]|uniref:YIP1 family protein n=2 Tax=Nostoc TaxID=1177 RepID=A0ABR8HZU3_9NOSO|nr:MULTISPECIES: Yip1 family protein [Nostoc]MBD2560761.1 YIP1 family protein [Nostoc linckia FACHB-391]MBD2644829.1 YIP1 family protein [Nostoc foliaceum FACHB-393]